MSLNGFDDAGFTELVAGGSSGLRDALGINDQQVAGRERNVARGTVPFGKEADDGGGGGRAPMEPSARGSKGGLWPQLAYSSSRK